MADVELLDFGDRRYGSQIACGEAVPRVHRKFQLSCQSRCVLERNERRVAERFVRVFPGVKLDCVGSQLPRHPNGVVGRPYEKARPYPGVAQDFDGASNSCGLPDDIQTAFCCHFLPTLGYERYLIRANGDRDRHHILGASDLQIEIRANRRAENSDVRVLDVATVLAQVGGDAIDAHLLAEERRLDRIGLKAAPRLPECRDMVNVHVKPLVACSHIPPEYNFFGMKKLILALALMGGAACASAPPGPSGSALSTGARTSVAAVERFFAAVRAQDLQAMGQVWGTSRGPARDNMPRAELEKREVILQCYFNYDSFRVRGESPISEIRHAVRVELVRGGLVREPTIYTVQASDGRWFVENLDMAAVKDFCAMAPVAP